VRLVGYGTGHEARAEHATDMRRQEGQNYTVCVNWFFDSDVGYINITAFALSAFVRFTHWGGNDDARPKRGLPGPISKRSRSLASWQLGCKFFPGI
jgi:hypothetical protein